jgi:hypothetical protein
MNKQNGIQIGDVTHHHDHPIKWVNFRTTNATVNKPQNPIPELLELEDSLLIDVLQLVRYCTN